ncbi:MAG: YdcF family protein [Blautia sp.]|nr:YdcF family protein [Blautia sp.]
MQVPFIDEIEEYMFHRDEPEKADIIFVPGNRYPQMAMEAARIYREGYAPYILPSGHFAKGQEGFAGALFFPERFAGPYETEWDFLKDVLVKEGVPEEAILKEDQATYTWQNALFSKEVLQKKGLTIHKAILCCKAVHARRSLLYYQTAFPDVTFLICPVSPDGVTRENWKDSQENIDEVMQELHRIVTQFSLWM